MIWFNWQIFIVTVICGACFAEQYLQKGKTCKVHHDSVDCSHLNLTTVPLDLPESVRKLDLSYNSLESLKPNQFSNLLNLTWLNISRNSIRTLPSSAFSGLEKLRILDISNNNSTCTFLCNITKDIVGLEVLLLHNNSYVNNNITLCIKEFTQLRNLSLDVFKHFHFNESLSLRKLEHIFFNPRLEQKFRLKNDSFAGFYPSPIRNLALDFHHSIDRPVEINFLRPFVNLNGSLLIHLGYYCSIKDVLRSLYGIRNRILESLYLGQNWLISGSVQYINDKDLKYLSSICVKKLDLSWDSIARIWSKTIWNSTLSKCLEVVNLQGNDFVKDNYLPILPLVNFPKIRDVNIAYFPPSSNVAIGRHIIPYVDSSNTTSTLGSMLRNRRPYNATIYVSDTLQSFNCNGVFTHFGVEMENITFKFRAVGMKMFSASKTNLNVCNRNTHDRYIRLEANLTYMDMSGWDCADLNPTFFSDTGGLLQLRTLLARNSKLKEGLGNDRNAQFLAKLIYLEKVDLSENTLNELHDSIFKDQYNSLKEVVLENNNFHRVPSSVLKIKNLRFLDMSKNNIVDLTHYEMKVFDTWQNLTIDFTENIFCCSCYCLSTLQWTSNNQHKIPDVANIRCRNTLVNIRDVLDNIRQFEIKCSSDFWLKASIIMLVFLSSTVFGCAIAYRYRYKILFVYLRFRKNIREGTEQNFAYDVFISYNPENESDTNWIKSQLNDFLTCDLNLQVAFEDQDFHPGKNYIRNLHELVDRSSRVIIVYQEDFIEYDWGECHLELAAMQTFRKQGSLIIIIRDNTRKQHIPLPLQRVWWKLKFIYWHGDDQHDYTTSLFWQRLKAALQD
ncbi:hypothetical protein FSP39_015192 [Pinctada imbricata]|uniref:TIR domain-containing protein n=1 Tax=Pinctada imbricata TaxID=66713 RepID=A0AA88YDB1_PINIB|nr:hypothetical protein FSP39_015192 [Pinctada imbricata]